MTDTNWIAYKVYKSNYCDPNELIGYFKTKAAAEMAKEAWIEKHKERLKSNICCHKAKDVIVEEIEIEA